MNVVLPELDGRLFTRAISFKAETAPDAALEYAGVLHEPAEDRVAFVAGLAGAWARLGATPRAERRLAIMLSDYPARGGRTGYACGLDTPASAREILDLLREAGYATGDASSTPAEMLAALTGDAREYVKLSLSAYHAHLAGLPPSVGAAIGEAWGPAGDDPACIDGTFRFPCLRAGNVVVVLQPDRGAREDRKHGYHDTSCPPRHGYVALYAALRRQERIDALVHLGTHGTLEWLPGKALALSEACFPEALLGPLPVVYPFIVNNPGEAVQAKRRICAVTIGHLTPPLSAAGLHGPLAELEGLLEEYAEADGVDRRRLPLIEAEILERAWRSGLAADCGVTREDPPRAPSPSSTRSFATSRTSPSATACMCSAARRQQMRARRWLKATLRSIDGAASTLDRAARGPAHRRLRRRRARGPARGARRTARGAGTGRRADARPARRAADRAQPDDHRSARRSRRGPPPPSARARQPRWCAGICRTKANTRARSCSTCGRRRRCARAATTSRRRSPTSARARPGTRAPTASPASRSCRIALLDRPRIDVTLRISGLFRDIFQAQIALFDMAVARVAALDEDDDWNPLAAARRAGGNLSRIFGGGANVYGAGAADAALDTVWGTRDDLARAYLAASTHAYGPADAGIEATAAFAAARRCCRRARASAGRPRARPARRRRRGRFRRRVRRRSAHGAARAEALSPRH